MIIPIPMFIIGTLALSTTIKRRKVRPTGSSGLSVADKPSSMSGQQDRLVGGARAIRSKSRNCARCVRR